MKLTYLTWKMRLCLWVEQIYLHERAIYHSEGRQGFHKACGKGKSSTSTVWKGHRGQGNLCSDDIWWIGNINPSGDGGGWGGGQAHKRTNTYKCYVTALKKMSGCLLSSPALILHQALSEAWTLPHQAQKKHVRERCSLEGEVEPSISTLFLKVGVPQTQLFSLSQSIHFTNLAGYKPSKNWLIFCWTSELNGLMKSSDKFH